jgi:hypothetical protein
VLLRECRRCPAALELAVSCIPCESDEDMRAFARRYLVPSVNQP